MTSKGIWGSVFIWVCLSVFVATQVSQAEFSQDDDEPISQGTEAPPAPPPPPPPPSPQAASSPKPVASGGEKSTSISLSGSFFGFYYTEYIPPPTDGEAGVLGGVNLEVRTTVAKAVVLYGSADVDFGQTKYSGALQNGTPLTSPTNDFIMNGELGVGYAFPVATSTRLIPYLGFGTHFWNRSLTGLGAYTENYLFFYFPVGLRLESKTSDRFEFALDASLHVNVGGVVYVLLSQLSPPEQNATGSLGSAVGVKVQAPLIFHLASEFKLRVAPFFEYFGIGQGAYFNTYQANGQFVDQSYEPASSTFLYGANVGVSYSF
jgi:hypothetical protein